MKKIGVGLIGTGYMGKCHAMAWTGVRPVFGDVPDIHLVHLGEASQELASKKGAEFGFAKASGTLLRRPLPGRRVGPVVSFAGTASTVALLFRL